MSPRLVLLAGLFSLAACATEEEEESTETDGADGVSADGADGTEDTSDSGTLDPSQLCVDLGLPVREFSPETYTTFQRRQPAGDFSVPLMDGSTFTLSEQWSGCETYAFIPHSLTDGVGGALWFTDLDKLIRYSDPNVHYFFVVTVPSTLQYEEHVPPMVEAIEEQLGRLSEDEADWWRGRLHVVSESSYFLDGLLKDAFSSSVASSGFAIDRFQNIRGFGYFSAVNEYNPSLSWPWEDRLSQVARELQYLNFEATRQEAMDAEDALVVNIFEGQYAEEKVRGTMSLPDAETLAAYDSMALEVMIECPDRDRYEIGNCGAWDYIAHTHLCDAPSLDENPYADQACQQYVPAVQGSCFADGTDAGVACSAAEDCAEVTGTDITCEGFVPAIAAERIAGTCEGPGGTADADYVCKADGTGFNDQTCACSNEMARYITTYHRESHWWVDASHSLGWVKEGGDFPVRFLWAVPWNTQPSYITMRARFTNKDKGGTPDVVVPLFFGRGLNESYNDRDPIDVEIPADATRVELVSIITGHGQTGDYTCAEFCRTDHLFTVGETTYETELTNAGTGQGCENLVPEGVVPNQAGTWWYGRNGWCPGQEVQPWVEDVTGDVTPGETTTISYQGLRNEREPDATDGGNIVLSSWLVVYR